MTNSINRFLVVNGSSLMAQGSWLGAPPGPGPLLLQSLKELYEMDRVRADRSWMDREVVLDMIFDWPRSAQQMLRNFSRRLTNFEKLSLPPFWIAHG